jgi:MoxR-like ATPase
MKNVYCRSNGKDTFLVVGKKCKRFCNYVISLMVVLCFLSQTILYASPYQEQDKLSAESAFSAPKFKDTVSSLYAIFCELKRMEKEGIELQLNPGVAKERLKAALKTDDGRQNKNLEISCDPVTKSLYLYSNKPKTDTVPVVYHIYSRDNPCKVSSKSKLIKTMEVGSYAISIYEKDDEITERLAELEGSSSSSASYLLLKEFFGPENLQSVLGRGVENNILEEFLRELIKQQTTVGKNLAKKDIGEEETINPKIKEAIETGNAICLDFRKIIDIEDIKGIFISPDTGNRRDTSEIADRLIEGFTDIEKDRVKSALVNYLSQTGNVEVLQNGFELIYNLIQESGDRTYLKGLRYVFLLSKDPVFLKADILAHTGRQAKTKGPRGFASIFLHIESLRIARIDQDGFLHVLQHEAGDLQRGRHEYQSLEEKNATDRFWLAVETLGRESLEIDPSDIEARITSRIKLPDVVVREIAKKIIEIHNFMQERVLIAYGGTPDFSRYIVTTRELHRFTDDFIMIFGYLLYKEIAPHDAVVTAFSEAVDNVYMDMLPEDFEGRVEEAARKRRQKQIETSISKTRNIIFSFIDRDLHEFTKEIIVENVTSKIDATYDFADYYSAIEEISNTLCETEHISIYKRTIQKLCRGLRSGRPMLFIQDTDSYDAVQTALERIAEKTDGTVINLACTPFSDRAQIVGGWIPAGETTQIEAQDVIKKSSEMDRQAAYAALTGIDLGMINPKDIENITKDKNHPMFIPLAMVLRYPKSFKKKLKYEEGTLAKIIREAEQNSSRNYYLVFDNIDAAPSEVRAQLNQILLYKEVSIPELQGKTLKLTPNIHLIFTTTTDAKIEDPAFYDRLLRKRVDPLTSKKRHVEYERGVKRMTIIDYLSEIKISNIPDLQNWEDSFKKLAEIKNLGWFTMIRKELTIDEVKKLILCKFILRETLKEEDIKKEDALLIKYAKKYYGSWQNAVEAVMDDYYKTCDETIIVSERLIFIKLMKGKDTEEEGKKIYEKLDKDLLICLKAYSLKKEDIPLEEIARLMGVHEGYIANWLIKNKDRLIDVRKKEPQIVKEVKEREVSDLSLLLELRFGFPEKTAEKMVELYEKIKKSDLGLDIYVGDLINIAIFVKGIGNAENTEKIIARESYLYLVNKLRKDNKSELVLVISEIFGNQEEYTSGITFNKDTGMLIADGVELRVPVNPEITRLVREGWDFEDALYKITGIVLTSEAIKMLSAMVRAYNFGKKVIILEGPTGTGKTFMLEGFKKLINARRFYGEPVHGRTEIERFIGHVKPTRHGYYRLDRNTPLKDIITNGGVAALSEANTRVDKYKRASVTYSLPLALARGDSRISLTEYPWGDEEADGQIVPDISVHGDVLVGIDINPAGYQARGTLAPFLRVYAPSVWVSDELSISDITKLADRFLKEKIKDNETRSRYAKILAEIHQSISSAIKEGVVGKDRERILTIRELMRAADDLGDMILSQGVDSIRSCILESYSANFKGTDRFTIKQIINEIFNSELKTSYISPEAEAVRIIEKYKGDDLSKKERVRLARAYIILGEVKEAKKILSEVRRYYEMDWFKEGTVQSDLSTILQLIIAYKELGEIRKTGLVLQNLKNIIDKLDNDTINLPSGRLIELPKYKLSINKIELIVLIFVEAGDIESAKRLANKSKSSYLINVIIKLKIAEINKDKGLLNTVYKDYMYELIRNFQTDGTYDTKRILFDFFITAYILDEEKIMLDMLHILKNLELPDIGTARLNFLNYDDLEKVLRVLIKKGDMGLIKEWGDILDETAKTSMRRESDIGAAISYARLAQIEKKRSKEKLERSISHSIAEKGRPTLVRYTIDSSPQALVQKIADENGMQAVWINVSSETDNYNLIGSFGPSTAGEKAKGMPEIRWLNGEITRIIKQYGNSSKPILIVLDQFQNMKPEVAVALNALLQERTLYTDEDTEPLVLPPNIRFIALANGKDKLPISLAEQSRWVQIDAEELTHKEVEESILDETRKILLQRFSKNEITQDDIKNMAELIYAICSVAKETAEDIEEESGRGQYFSLRYFERLVKAVVSAVNNANISEEELAKILFKKALSIYGASLEETYKKKFEDKLKSSFNVEPDKAGTIQYDSEHKILKIGDVEIPTADSNQAMNNESEELFLEPIAPLLEVERATIEAFKQDNIVVYEGDPGGGKTEIAIDMGRRLGLRSHVYSVHGDVELTDWIGHFSQREDGNYVLGTEPDISSDVEGNPVYKFPNSEFLDFLVNGGLWIIDEGAIGKRSKNLLAWLAPIARGEKKVYIYEHPGRDPIELTVNPNFRIIITSNPFGTFRRTPGRYRIPDEILLFSQHIAVNSKFTKSDLVILLRSFLKGFNIQEDELEKLINHMIEFHLGMQEMIEKELGIQHPERYLYTLRDLKRWAKDIMREYRNKSGNLPMAIVEGLTSNYRDQFTNTEDLEKIDAFIRHIFSDYYEQEITSHLETSDEVSYDGNAVRDIFALPLVNGQEDPEWQYTDSPDLWPAGIRTNERTLKSVIRAMKAHAPSLLICDPGTRPAELLEKVARDSGYEMRSLWPAKNMTMHDLLGGMYPVLGEVKPGSPRLVFRDGFISRHLVTEEKRAEKGPCKILVVHNIDTLPGEVREALNNFLLNGYIENSRGEKFYLPQNVHIIATISESSRVKFSSAFFNRFRKIGLRAMDYESRRDSELEIYFRKRYGLSPWEAKKIRNCHKAVVNLAGHGGFTGKDDYLLTVEDAIHLAEWVVQARQESTEFLNVQTREDKIQILERIIVREALRYYENRLCREVKEGNYSDIERIRLKLKELFLTDYVSLPEEEIAYDSDGMVSSISGIPVIKGSRERKRPAEIERRYSLKYVPTLIKIMSAILRASKPVLNGKGIASPPRLVALSGETGIAKTTVGVNLAQVMGLDCYIYSTHGQSEPEDLSFDIVPNQTGGYVPRIKPFLKKVGEVKCPKSGSDEELEELLHIIEGGNTVLIIDEVNIRPEIAYVLAPLAYGMKAFEIEFPGRKPIKVTVGDNLIFAFTFNPETYSGRSRMPQVIIDRTVQIAVPSKYEPNELQAIVEWLMGLESDETNGESQTGIRADVEVAPFSTILFSDMLPNANIIGIAGISDSKKYVMQLMSSHPELEAKINLVKSEVLERTGGRVRDVIPGNGWAWITDTKGRAKVMFDAGKLIDYEPDAIIAAIIHEMRHKDYTLKQEEIDGEVEKDPSFQGEPDLTDSEKEILKQTSVYTDRQGKVCNQFRGSFFNALEDGRINGIEEEDFPGRSELIKRELPILAKVSEMDSIPFSKREELDRESPDVSFQNEVLYYAYYGKLSEYHDKRSSDNPVRKALELTLPWIKKAIESRPVITEEDSEETAKKKVIDAHILSLKIIARHIYPIYDELGKISAKNKAEKILEERTEQGAGGESGPSEGGEKGEGQAEGEGSPGFGEEGGEQIPGEGSPDVSLPKDTGSMDDYLDKLPPDLRKKVEDKMADAQKGLPQMPVFSDVSKDGEEASESEEGEAKPGDEELETSEEKVEEDADINTDAGNDSNGEVKPGNGESKPSEDSELDISSEENDALEDDLENRNRDQEEEIAKELYEKNRLRFRLLSASNKIKQYAQRLIDLLMDIDESQQEELLSRSGRIIDIIAFLLGKEKFFRKRTESFELVPVAFEVVIDTSGSVLAGGLKDPFAEAVAYLLTIFGLAQKVSPENFKFALSGFADRYGKFSGFDESYADDTLLEKQVEIEGQMGTGGSTNMFSAVRGVIENMRDRPEQEKFAIIFTDGIDTEGNMNRDGTPGYELKKAMQEAENLGIEIVAIGIGRGTEMVKMFKKYIQLDTQEEIPEALLLLTEKKITGGRIGSGDLRKELSFGRSIKLAEAQAKLAEIEGDGDERTNITDIVEIDLGFESVSSKISSVLKRNGITIGTREKQGLEEAMRGSLAEGKRFNLENWLRCIKGVSPDTIMSMMSEISIIITESFKGLESHQGSCILGAVLSEIADFISVETDQKRRSEFELSKSINTIIASLVRKGIDQNAARYYIDLLASGMQVLDYDPSIELGKIDNGYFEMLNGLMDILTDNRDKNELKQKILEAAVHCCFLSKIESLLGGEDIKIKTAILERIKNTEKRSDLLSALREDSINGFLYRICRGEELNPCVRSAIEKLLRQKRLYDSFMEIKKLADSLEAGFKGAEGVEVPGSQFNIAAGELRVWNKLNAKRVRENLDLTVLELDVPQSAEYLYSGLDFTKGASVVNGGEAEDIKFLSGQSSVMRDIKNLCDIFKNSPIEEIFKKDTPVEVVLDIEDYINFSELKITNKPDGTRQIIFGYQPGLLAILKMKQIPGSQNIHINFRVSKENQEDVRHILQATGFLDKQIRIRDKEDILLLQEKILSEGRVKSSADIVFMANERWLGEINSQKDVRDAVKTGHTKIIGLSDGNSLHAGLLFAVMYAKAGELYIDGRLSDDIVNVIRSLSRIGLTESEVERAIDMVREGEIFIIKIIRISETLAEFQNRRILIDTAA